jgi:hypothetical protein
MNTDGRQTAIVAAGDVSAPHEASALVWGKTIPGHPDFIRVHPCFALAGTWNAGR